MGSRFRLDGRSISQFVHYFGAPQSLQSVCGPTVAPAPKMSVATRAVQYTQDAAILVRTVSQVVHSISASCTDACSTHTGALCLFSQSLVDARPHIIKYLSVWATSLTACASAHLAPDGVA